MPLLHFESKRIVWQPREIRRRDQTRTMTVKIEISGRYAEEVLADVSARVDGLVRAPDWPDR